MFGFSSKRCDVCGNILRRSVHHWEIDGKPRVLCPPCNSRYERKISREAADRGGFQADQKKPASGCGSGLAVVALGCLAVFGVKKFVADRGASSAPATAAVDSPAAGQDSYFTAPSPLPPTPAPSAPAAPTSVVAIARAKPAPSLPPAAEFARQVGLSQTRAVRLYPELGKAGTALNLRFVSALHAWRARGDLRLTKPDWPERLADECAAER